ncbi:MAG TPA: hypothetical protein VF469_22445, partial [Kofleriaceae bacterium]
MIDLGSEAEHTRRFTDLPQLVRHAPQPCIEVNRQHVPPRPKLARHVNPAGIEAVLVPANFDAIQEHRRDQVEPLEHQPRPYALCQRLRRRIELPPVRPQAL